MPNSEDKETLRPITPDEVPLLRPCLEKLAAYHNQVATSFSGIYPTMPIDTHLAHMKDHINHGTALLVGLFLPDGTLGGFGMASHEDNYGEIDYLFINNELRGGGRGGRILGMLQEYLKGQGVRFIDLHVVLGNPAKRFYQSFGFKKRSETLSMEI